MTEPTSTPLYPLAAPTQQQLTPTVLPHDPVAEHIAAHLGRIDTVFHDTIADPVQVDIHVVPANERTPFLRLVTSGMSSRPMSVPEGAPPFGELMMALPADWKLDEASVRDERWYWPVALLRHLAHYPHQHATWLGLGHTVPNGHPAKPYAKGVEFTGAILLPPASAPEAFAALERDGKDIYFHCVVPLYEAEMDLVKRKGFPALLDGFNDKGVTDLVVPGRKNTVKKKFLGLF
ncbi:suppressor of fused domain protein [Massilia sp. LC238]|uniref:suppressor of fused domain protein n=1 Tax=Massilia sp. LC238 TaxID=1502852 RepID=UPI0004E3821A|nr:suppressor of fused domain protein [Massilia sp. LC238]KFC67035.1 Tetratricopeptide repeat protein [Massilia sp. LC238]